MALANTAGGTLLIGVEDKTRHVRGVSDPFELDERDAMAERGAVAERGPA